MVVKFNAKYFSDYYQNQNFKDTSLYNISKMLQFWFRLFLHLTTRLIEKKQFMLVNSGFRKDLYSFQQLVNNQYKKLCPKVYLRYYISINSFTLFGNQLIYVGMYTIRAPKIIHNCINPDDTLLRYTQSVLSN